MTRRFAGVVGLAIVCLMAGTHGYATMHLGQIRDSPIVEKITGACRGVNPYFAVTRSLDRQWILDERVTIFHDTNSPNTLASARVQAVGLASLAKETDVGAIYGLGYDWRRQYLYTSAYYSLGPGFMPLAVGPMGPGGIYRIDLSTGEVTQWKALAAGTVPDPAADVDERRAAIGSVGIGDIDVNDDATELFVANLGDQRIYRIGLPDGNVLGSIQHGAAGQTWAGQARLFGLGTFSHWLYHGITNGNGEVFVYRSNFDGSDLVTVAQFGWTDLNFSRRTKSNRYVVADIVVQDSEQLILGLRGDWSDWRGFDAAGQLVTLQWDRRAQMYRPRANVFSDDDPHIYGGNTPQPSDDPGSTGSLALGPCRRTLVTPLELCGSNCGGVMWFDTQSGKPSGPASDYEWLFADSGGLGDVEMLCQSSCATYLPLIQLEACTQRFPLDLAIAIDMSTTMRASVDGGIAKYEVALNAASELATGLLSGEHENRIALLGFNDTSWIEQPLSSNLADVLAAIQRLPVKIAEGTRLDLAMLQAAESLATRRAGAKPMVLLLSDGKPNRVPTGADGRPETTVLAAAEQLKSTGARVHVVGFGNRGDLDEDLLTRMASNAGDYRYAATGASLVESFRAIQKQLACP